MKTVVVMPAYRAAATVESTVRALPGAFDQIILCDDASPDNTVVISEGLGITTLRHAVNRGYGGNQKTLYSYALKQGADVVVMVHPDNQYSTKNVPEMVHKLRSGRVDMVLGTRMKNARQNGMPVWKWLANRGLTIMQNMVYGTHLSEFHTGLRAYRTELLRQMPFNEFSEDFVFDSQVIAWTLAHDYKIDEVDTNCYYGGDVSSINFRRSLKYGLHTLGVLRWYRRMRSRSI